MAEPDAEPTYCATSAPAGGGRPRVLCLHGFRSSAELMKVQLRALGAALGGAVELVVRDAPTPATGPADPAIPVELQTHEWYGEAGGPFERAWLRCPDRAALDATVAALDAEGPWEGVLGFSQGGAVARLVQARWHSIYSIP